MTMNDIYNRYEGEEDEGKERKETVSESLVIKVKGRETGALQKSTFPQVQLQQDILNSAQNDCNCQI